jgi:hypothetical protein
VIIVGFTMISCRTQKRFKARPVPLRKGFRLGAGRFDFSDETILPAERNHRETGGRLETLHQ